MLDMASPKSMFTKIYQAIPSECFDNPDHDFSHSLRVAHNAIAIAEQEGGNHEVLVAAALLHDIGNLPKNHPESHLSSERSAQQASKILSSVNFSSKKIHFVLDAIRCHSFSRGLIPTTLEGKIFQDADRLDALGAIGIARAFSTGARFNSKFYSIDDPFLERGRTPDDKKYMIDHFYVKLFKLPQLMQTQTGKRLARARITLMKKFLVNLKKEVFGANL